MGDFVSEAGHWYDKNGKPCYTQIVASGKNKGKERNTTLRDAKKLHLVPSVTTITGILDKPALTNWQINEAVKKALDPSGYKENTAAADGTRIHGIVEQWLEDGKVPSSEDGAIYVDVFGHVLDDLGILHPESERSFACEDFGGCIDLRDRTANIILDIKTKDLSAEDVKSVHAGKKRLTYDEHVMQLAAYRRCEDGMHDARCFNLFLSRTDPYAYYLHEWPEDELVRGWNLFYHLKEAWKIMKRYDPTDTLDA